MKHIDDNDIQFLGGENYKPSLPHRRKRWAWIAAAVIAVLVLLVSGVYVGKRIAYHLRWAVSFEYPVSRSSAAMIAELSKASVDTTASGVTMTVDSMNNVPFKLYQLHNLKADFAIQAPADSDSTLCLAIHAWDYYWDDNKRYRHLGDYVYKGDDIASGSGRAGFVAIVGNKWIMGISPNDSIKDYVKARGGSMFRQFALVSAGQICMKQFVLKGKVTRAALARMKVKGTNHYYFVETIHKESLYDFAEALADYGFIDAIYLTGGSNKDTFYRAPEGNTHGKPNWKEKPWNLLVFKI